MKLTAYFRCVLGAAALLAALPLPAETHASCCRCGGFYKLSDEGFGYLRHHVGFCPACTAEMGGDVAAYLERLRGRQRGINEAALLTNQRKREAEEKRDKARDSIYGREGHAVGFFSSLMSFAAQGAGGTFKAVAKHVKTGLKWYNRAADSLEHDFNWVYQEGKGWVKKHTVGAAQDKAKLKAAAAIGQSYYNSTKDARGATQRFLAAHKDIKRGVSVLEGAIDFHDKTSKLADAIQAYLEYRGDAARLEKEKDELDAAAQKIQDERDKLEHCLELQRAQDASKKSGALPAAAWTARFARLDAPAPRRTAQAPAPHEPNEGALRSALTALRLLEKDLAEFEQHLDADFLPPLLPFWLDVQDEFSRDLNHDLLRLADPAAEKASSLFDRIIRRAEGAADTLKGTMPPPESL